MMPFAKRRFKRTTAIAALLVWLFATSVGWANACVLQPQGTHGHAATSEPAASGAPPVVSAGHLGVVPDHDEDGHGNPGKAPCLKVCDDGTKSLVTWTSSIDLTDAGIVPPTYLAWHAVEASVSLNIDRPGTEPPPRLALPLRIRYSRLAL
ncbi:MAG: hypothetical protein ABI633_03905 [Burkholderiales bacterium]